MWSMLVSPGLKQQRWSHCGYIQAVRVHLIIQQLVETPSAATSCSDSFLHRSLSPLQRSFGPLVFVALLQLIWVCIHILWRCHHSVAVRWRSGLWPWQQFDPLHWASFTDWMHRSVQKSGIRWLFTPEFVCFLWTYIEMLLMVFMNRWWSSGWMCAGVYGFTLF